MGDFRIAGIGYWSFGERDRLKLFAAREGARVPAAVLVLKDGLMTFGATPLTHKRGRLELEGWVLRNEWAWARTAASLAVPS